jgi:hypothetical protein
MHKRIRAVALGAALAMGAGAAAEAKTFYWISHGSPADPVWTYFLAGAEQWAADTGQTVNTSFHSGDVPSHQEAFRAAIAAGADAIVSSSPDPGSLVEVVSEARAAGIPVININTPDDALAERAAAFYTSLGKHPVRLAREMPGHIAGRLSAALWREAVHLVAEGVASVEAVDAALTQGPGVRWAVQGAHLGYHMGGGPGGIAHYLAHLGPSQEHRWQTLGTPTLDAETRQQLIDGIAEATKDRPVSELESQRDAALVKLLRARR